jgi:LmbE family N-acetylglucosaminyl deacetylase
MIALGLPEAGRQLQILCLGCHSDDIEIGCGGAILRLAAEHPECAIHWVVFSAKGVREEEARRAADLFAGTRLQGPRLQSFPDGFLPYVGGEVKAIFEKRFTGSDLHA